MNQKPTQAFLFRMSDFEKLGIKPDAIEQWEDGMRTDGSKGTFEWWYFDAKLSDGSTLVIVFYTKNLLRVNTPIQPMITVTLTSATGETLLDYVINAPAGDSTFSKDTCDVRIGTNTFKGNLTDYHIKVNSKQLTADLTLHSTTPPYRAATGHAFFEQNGKERYFAWLNAVPQGIVSGTLTINGIKCEVSGSGYHDHNWGDSPMPKLLHHWYWGRAKIGDYTVITSRMTSTKAFGHTHATTFLVTYKDKILAFDPRYVKVSYADIYTDQHSGKPVAGKIIFDYNYENDRYKITFARERDISNTLFTDKVEGLKRQLLKLLRFDGAYLRFSGKVTLEAYEKNKLIDTATDESSVWELMYLGHAIPHE